MIKILPILKVLLIIIATQILQTQSTTFTLKSYKTSQQQTSSQVQVPQTHDHPFSCELVFFNVYNYKFYINVTNVYDNVSQVQLNAWTFDQKLVYNKTRFVSNNTVVFPVDFQKQQESSKLQMIMNFNLTYNRTVNGEQREYSQIRKAYIMFVGKQQQNYVFRLPKGTIILTTTIGLILTLILPWNIQYRKFLPFTYNLLTCIIYITLLLVALYLQMIFGNGNNIFLIQTIVIGVFQFICMVTYSQDLLMMYIDRSNTTFIIGFLFTIVVFVLDNFLAETKDAWFLNDIIAIMVAGAFIKFVIIRKMKTAVWAIVLMWVFCILREFAKQFHLQKFDQGFGIRVLPIFVQLPTNWIDDASSLTCSAYGSSKIISFGIILNYCKRVDLYLSTQFYRILASIIAVLCIIGQLVFNIIFEDLPTIQVMSVILYYPLVLFLILFFANKRGEWTQVWDGSFYDMAVNRASIRRQISFSELQSQFGKQWMINSARLSGTAIGSQQNIKLPTKKQLQTIIK